MGLCGGGGGPGVTCAAALSPPAPELGTWAAPVKSGGKETLPVPRLAGATVVWAESGLHMLAFLVLGV